MWRRDALFFFEHLNFARLRDDYCKNNNKNTSETAAASWAIHQFIAI